MTLGPSATWKKLFESRKPYHAVIENDEQRQKAQEKWDLLSEQLGCLIYFTCTLKV